MTSSGRAVALWGLVALALCLAPFSRPSEIAARLDASRDPAFAFDPRYRAFLDAVSRLTSTGATVAVLAPDTSPLYVAQAAYQLAPRRIVGREHSVDAPFLAVYRRGVAPAVPAGAVPLPGGFLLKR